MTTIDSVPPNAFAAIAGDFRLPAEQLLAIRGTGTASNRVGRLQKTSAFEGKSISPTHYMNSQVPFQTASENDIARRARALWAARGCPVGCDVEIWLEAERELTAALGTQPTSPTRLARTSTAISAKGTRSKEETKPIDARELSERLDNFGEPQRRSPTSVDLT